MTFTIEQIYGCTREQFCERTGTTLEDMKIRLSKEVTILEVNLAKQREAYRSGGAYATDQQKNRAKLIKFVEDKIAQKKAKAKDINRQLDT